MNNIEGFEKERKLSLVYKSDELNTKISFEYGKVKITTSMPEEKAIRNNGEVTTEVILTRNQVKDIIDMYAKLYEPRIVGWSN